jgi:Ricin-type beta-trefoil lectin domain-like
LTFRGFSQKHPIISWSDEQITSGSKWFEEINSALINTNVAVLLVTPNFLASDFIYEHELGPFLKQAQQGGVRILWVHVRTCAYKLTALKDYQAVLSPARPLADMTEAERDRAWVKICEEIEKAVNPSKDAAPQSGPTATQNRELSAKPAAPAAAMTLSPPVIATPPAEAEATAFDTRFYYRLTNDFLGQGKSLDVYNDGSYRLRMSESADSPGQLWQLVDRGDGKYSLRNAYLGNSYSLDVINYGKKDTPCVAESGHYTG